MFHFTTDCCVWLTTLILLAAHFSVIPEVSPRLTVLRVLSLRNGYEFLMIGAPHQLASVMQHLYVCCKSKEADNTIAYMLPPTVLTNEIH